VAAVLAENFASIDELMEAGVQRLSEINEANIQNAANHVYMGNAVKELLGLRAMPQRQYDILMKATGQDISKTTGHTYAKGTKGGTADEDREKQRELAELCIAIANAGNMVVRNEDGSFAVVPQDEEMQGITDEVAVGKKICETISTFNGKDGVVKGLTETSKLKGKRLEITLETAKKLTSSIVTAKGGI